MASCATYFAGQSRDCGRNKRHRNFVRLRVSSRPWAARYGLHSSLDRILLTSDCVFPQDVISKDNMAKPHKNTAKKDEMGKDAMSKDGMAKDEMKK